MAQVEGHDDLPSSATNAQKMWKLISTRLLPLPHDNLNSIDDEHSEGRPTYEDLRLKLREREERIAVLESLRKTDETSSDELRSKLETTLQSLKKQEKLHHMELEHASREKKAFAHRMDAFMRDTTGNFRREYMEMVKEGSPKLATDDPSYKYISRLQSKLTMALHKMETLTTQLDMAKSAFERMISSYKKEFTEAVGEQCQVEVRLMNELSVLLAEKGAMEAEYEAKLQSRQDTIDELDAKVKGLEEANQPVPGINTNETHETNLPGKIGGEEEDLNELAEKEKEIALLKEDNRQKDELIRQLTKSESSSIDKQHKKSSHDSEGKLEEPLLDMINNCSYSVLLNQSIMPEQEPRHGKVEDIVATFAMNAKSMQENLETLLKEKKNAISKLDKSEDDRR